MLPKSLNILRRWFGKVALTGKDFVSLCAANGIMLKITDQVDRGFYYCSQGKHYIVLSSKLSARERARVGWHEFAHFLQNYRARKTVVAYADLCPEEPYERLANVFAAIATRPDLIKITGPMDFVKQLMRTAL